MQGKEPTLAGYLRAYLDRLGRGDYFAILAYLSNCERYEAELQAMRSRVMVERRVATCRTRTRFLHSTGQVYKGGPNTGVFLRITCDDARDLAIPGRRLSLGIVKAAQARGDLAVLGMRGRRALRVHLAHPDRGLVRLRNALEGAAPLQTNSPLRGVVPAGGPAHAEAYEKPVA